jgi:hypothetical protein
MQISGERLSLRARGVEAKEAFRQKVLDPALQVNLVKLYEVVGSLCQLYKRFFCRP